MIVHWDRGANYDGPSCGAGVGYSVSVPSEVSCTKCLEIIWADRSTSTSTTIAKRLNALEEKIEYLEQRIRGLEAWKTLY